MKKILQLLVLASLLIPSTTVFAGDDDDKQFYKGVRVGYQGSNIDHSDLGDLTSFYVGIFGVKKIGTGKLLSMYSGLEYYQTGASDNSDNEAILGYLSIPINLRLSIGPVYAFGGFNPSFKIYESIKSAGIDISDLVKVNGFDIGGQIGVGVKILFLGAEVKYNQGLVDIISNSTEGSATHHLQAGICVYF